MMIRTIFICALLWASQAVTASGKLMIVGGALSPDNEAIHKAFLDGIPADQKLAIISAASGTPVRSATLMMNDFERYGFDSNRIILIKLAVKDDNTTPEDESKWAGNGSNREELAKLEDVGGVWFTGGDQARIAETLLLEGGKDTPMAAKLRTILAEGGIIGGTSAGAAMMSRAMILFGDPLASMLLPIGAEDESALHMGIGMGFLPLGIVDQHFDQRARLGRLVRAISILPAKQRLGFGIDENTGFLVDLKSQSLKVIGAGALSMVDGRDATFGAKDTVLSAENLVLHVFTDGDRLDLANGKPMIASYKKRTIGNEYFREKRSSGGGMAVPYPGIADYLASNLVDNSAQEKSEAISFASGGQGLRYVFRQWRSSNGFWGRGPDGKARYSITDIRLSIEPITVTIQ